MRLGAAAAVTIGRPAVAVPAAAPTRDTERRHFDGIAIFAITPMRLRDGRAEVDFEGFERNMRFYVGHDGAYSLAVCGAVGEYHVLTPEERGRLIGIAAAVKGKRLLGRRRRRHDARGDCQRAGGGASGRRCGRAAAVGGHRQGGAIRRSSPTTWRSRGRSASASSRIDRRFDGGFAGGTIEGEVDLGEYGKARWTARRQA
jgi:hypothetical protein